MFINDWKDSQRFGMIAGFEGIYISPAEFEAVESPYPNVGAWLERKAEMRKALDSEKYQNLEVLLASYTYEEYSGSAFVLFKKDGKLWEVNAGHCSCYGLEHQWEPEETTPEALIARKWFDSDGVTVNQIREALTRAGYAC